MSNPSQKIYNNPFEACCDIYGTRANFNYLNIDFMNASDIEAMLKDTKGYRHSRMVDTKQGKYFIWIS